MPNVFELQSTIMLLLNLLMLALKLWAFVDSLVHRSQEYHAASKWSKPGWCIVLGITLAVQVVLVGGFGILNLIGVVAALVYLLDVRPALRALTRH